MTKSASPRRVGRAVLAVALLVPLGLALFWLATRRDAHGSRFDDALDRALLPVLEQHEAQLKFGVATPTQLRVMARAVAERSVQQLAPRDLELWQATRLRVAEASPSACARLWKGGDDAFLAPAIANLGDEALDAYVDMLARGFALRLERKPPPEPPLGSIDRGLAAIALQLPAASRAAFQADATRRDLSDQRACELFLTFARGASALDPSLRTDFLRGLAKELQVPPG